MIRTEEDIADALAALTARDPHLMRVVERAGPVPLRARRPGLAGLVAIVSAQQVSKASAEAMFARLETLVDLDDPTAIAAVPEEVFRRAGLSRGKERTTRAIAAAAACGDLDLAAVAVAETEEAIAALVALPGIGRWTAECYLLFAAGHPDVFPSGDLALQVAVADALGLPERPKDKALAGLAACWSPHRSVAARLFWAYYAAITRRDAAPARLRDDGAGEPAP